MAIIVDPDNLDRRQIIFGTEVNGGQQISARDVGAVVHANYLDATGGVTTGAARTFTDSGATFQTDLVAVGDVLCMFTGTDAGHFIILSITSETVLEVETDHPVFSGDTAIVYDIRDATGGTIVDGLTEQALYSFGKEEWRTDSEAFGSDDLIRHEFPFEAITREQMEIGGGTAHDNWDYNDRDSDYTKKKIRTGGWADKNSVSTTLTEYSGILTLGSIDADAQVYYQQVNEAETPTDFAFTGPVNEAILTFTDGGADNRTYLKLFVRKKYRTYVGSEIADIGVTQLETIVNRFPLQHTADPAIVATDGAILGDGTFRGQGANLESQTDGATTSGLADFTSALALFTTNGVVAGDTLHITAGATTLGYFTILSVDTETTLTLAADADFTTWSASDTSITYNVTSTNILTGSTDGALADVDSDTGTLTSATGGFAGTVAAGDMVVITEAASDHRGVYKVVSQDSDTVLTLNTSDRIFTTVSNIDFYVVEPGMYLEYKEDAISLAAPGNLTFADAGPDTITRTSGSWITDGVTAGSVIVITGSTSNDGSYTVASRTALVATLIATDTLTAEGPVAATATAYDGFKRTIASVTYSFHWRLFGIDALLADCYQFVQHQLRQSTDIDFGPGVSRGDVTDLLMSFASPTGVTFDMYIDDLNAADTNNVTYRDATYPTSGLGILEDFVAAGSITFNENLQNDASAEYTMFFTNSDAGTPGSDFGTPAAIIVQDSTPTNIAGNVGGSPSVSFTYDYDNNVQRGGGSAGTDAPVTVVGIGLATAQYVLLQGTIVRSKSNGFALVAALERNYSNP